MKPYIKIFNLSLVVKFFCQFA